jgi:hypothetical protein
MAEVKGGQQLDNVLAAIAKKLKGGGTVRVGFLEGSTYPDGTPTALVAAVQEYGSPAQGIPPRPFFRNMIKANAADWPRRVENTLKAADYDTAVALGRMGEGIARALRESIIRTNSPPLAPETVRRKGFEKPLVDTGHMLASVDYEVTVGDTVTKGQPVADAAALRDRAING